MGEALAQHLRALLYQHRWRVDLVIPVPLSTQRLRERGYNQAGLLAFPLAIACRLTYSPYSLQRVHETRSQVGLNEKERLHNVRGAFRANPHKVRGRTALIVDDVATTGATIESCASALLEAGAVSVYGITLARALLHRDGVDTPK
ncbi:MAG: phosphoribosyltransferase family protein [Anaerolineaceae bacterium]|nr:phosphoribosyltransferase family protein [Anaerolineaceae bacterium]